MAGIDITQVFPWVQRSYRGDLLQQRRILRGTSTLMNDPDLVEYLLLGETADTNDLPHHGFEGAVPDAEPVIERVVEVRDQQRHFRTSHPGSVAAGYDGLAEPPASTVVSSVRF